MIICQLTQVPAAFQPNCSLSSSSLSTQLQLYICTQTATHFECFRYRQPFVEDLGQFEWSPAVLRPKCRSGSNRDDSRMHGGLLRLYHVRLSDYHPLGFI